MRVLLQLGTLAGHFVIFQATAQGLPAGRLVGCKGDDENRFHIAQFRAVANAAGANKRKFRDSRGIRQ